MHTTAGYLLWASFTHHYTFDYHVGDIYACVADIGWITGHSYIVYGPLANGATTLMFESLLALVSVGGSNAAKASAWSPPSIGETSPEAPVRLGVFLADLGPESPERVVLPVRGRLPGLASWPLPSLKKDLTATTVLKVSPEGA